MTTNAETIIPDAPVVEAETIEATQDETPAEVESQAESEAEQEHEEEKVPKGVQKRIDAITKEKYEERRERQAAQERADRLERELAEFRQSGQQQPQRRNLENGAPNPENYAAGRYDPDYLEALTDYKVNLMFTSQQNKITMAQKQSHISELQEAARTAHADYDTIEQDFFQHPLTTVPEFRELLLDSENPAEMSYYLGKNPDEMDKLGEMTPAQALRYIGRLEAKINTPSLEQNKKTVSNAPKPIAPLGSAKTSAVITDPSEAQSMADYVKLREAQRK